jgi:signal peptidase II
MVLVAGSIVVADQWVKYRVVETLTTRLDGLPTLGAKLKAMYSGTSNDEASLFYGLHFRPKRSITVIPNFFRIRYAENPGAAWGLFRTVPENLRIPLFHLVSLGAVILISVYYARLTGSANERWAHWGLPFVLGGALGNYVDRIARGFVVDFLEAHWMDKVAWPSFNVADSCICIGVGMLLIDSMVRKESKVGVPSKASS